jgi:hypothetical protein
VDTLRTRPASRTSARLAGMAHGDQRGRAITDGALHHETARNKRRRSKCLLHDVDSLRNNTKQSPNFIESESEPKLDADRGSNLEAD